MTEQVFTARLAATFETQPVGERLYEVVSPDGERLASTTSEYEAHSLAGKLNSTLNAWAELVGEDAVLA